MREAHCPAESKGPYPNAECFCMNRFWEGHAAKPCTVSRISTLEFAGNPLKLRPEVMQARIGFGIRRALTIMSISQIGIVSEAR